MDISLSVYLLTGPLCLLAGFVDAIAGGGGLISLPAFIFAGLPVHNALATNKLQCVLGTSFSAWRYAKEGYMRLDLALIGVACGLAGSACGARLALATDDFAFRVLILLLLPFAFWYALRGLKPGHEIRPQPPVRARVLVAVIALVVGVYDGFLGPGTGTMLMLLLTALAGQSLERAAGTTKAVNLATNVAALAVFLNAGASLIALGLFCGLCSVVGNVLGARCFVKKGVQVARPLMLIMLSLVGVKLLLDVWRRLGMF